MDEKKGPYRKAHLIDELCEASEHLNELIERISNDPEYDEDYFRVDLGHIYAHLNRVWHTRNDPEYEIFENWDENSKFPKDLEPVG